VKPPPQLPADWPVSSYPVTYPNDASALRPGSLLQHKCSGRDIHLPRSAVTAPNIDKEKGKFLLILPGVMSFHKKPPSATRNGTTNSTANVPKDDDNKKDKEEEGKDNDTDDDDDDNDDDNDDNDDVIVLDEDEEEEGKERSTTKGGEALSSQEQQTSSSKKQSQPQPQPPTSLGKVEGLRTDHPTFTIPFPHLRKNLVFPGKKVTTSSKYIMLACSNKQKGSVQCKVCMYVCIFTQNFGQTFM
jgi:hypothetical protein